MAYERQSPDYTWLVAKVAGNFPKEWDLANENKYGTRTDDFIKRFAWEAHKVDPKIGLNGKRGNPFDISKDAVAYKNLTVPADKGACEVIDIIVGSNHTPSWQDATLPNVAGAWVEPQDPGQAMSPDNPTTGDPGNSNRALQEQIDELKQQINEIAANSLKRGDNVSLKTQEWDGQQGKYVCAERNQGSRLIANRDSGGGNWETFTIE